MNVSLQTLVREPRVLVEAIHGVSPPGFITGTPVGVLLAVERAIDGVIEDSFPASDPPSWNPGTASPAPAAHKATHRVLDETGADVRTAGVARHGVIDVSRPTGDARPFTDALISLAGAAGVALLLGVGILLISIPIALFVGGLIIAIGWLFNLVSV